MARDNEDVDMARKIKPRKREPRRFVSEAQLARLRDEIEGVLNAARDQLDRAGRISRQTGEDIETVHEEVLNMKRFLGLDQSKQYLSIMNEPVTAAYFHAWVTRINERLDKLERLHERRWPKGSRDGTDLQGG